MQKVVNVLMVFLGVLAAMFLGGAAMIGLPGFGMDSGMMDGIRATISPTILYAIVGLGLLLVFWLARTRTLPVTAKSSSTTASSTSALDVSKMRYAKGEITKEQYDAIKRDLGK